MKNMLKRVIVLVIVATIFVMPASTVLAATTPTLVYDLPGFKYFKYEPPYYLEAGQQMILYDTTTSDGRFLIKAGAPSTFSMSLYNSSRFRVLIAYDNGYYDSGVITTDSYIFDIPIQNRDMRYQVWVAAQYDCDVHTYIISTLP